MINKFILDVNNFLLKNFLPNVKTENVIDSFMFIELIFSVEVESYAVTINNYETQNYRVKFIYLKYMRECQCCSSLSERY